MGNLLDLLALLLVGTNHQYSLEETTGSSITLKIAKYALNISGITADVLTKLDRAQRQYEEDSSNLRNQPAQTRGEAVRALDQISQLGMEIAHPVLHRYEYQGRSDWSTLRLLQGWHAYPSEWSDEQRAAALY